MEIVAYMANGQSHAFSQQDPDAARTLLADMQQAHGVAPRGPAGDVASACRAWALRSEKPAGVTSPWVPARSDWGYQHVGVR